MARAHAANACVQSDSIKGLAQSIAKPAYHRLLTAEPALRRAVPTLIIAFLITICLGAFVQVIDQNRQKRGAMKRDLAALSDILAERLDRLTSVRRERLTNIEKMQELLPDLIPSWGTAYGRHVIITGADHRVLARVPIDGAGENDRILDIVSTAQLLIAPGQQGAVSDMTLPNGTGKTARVVVFATGDRAEAARAAGADVVGDDDLIARISEGWVDFDAAVASPELMGKVGRLGKVLGPRNLMPNPKTGTVTPDVAKAVADIKGGKIDFRVDKHSNLHFIIGKTSFEAKALVENYAAALEEVLRLKPSSSKGRYISKATVATTFGPGVPMDPNVTSVDSSEL